MGPSFWRTWLTAPLVGLAIALLLLIADTIATASTKPGTSPNHQPSSSAPEELRPAAGPFSGNLGISGDGLGVAKSSTGQIQARVRAPHSTILLALLYVKTNYQATISQIGFAGATVALTFVPGEYSWWAPTYRGDVTSIVAAAVGSGSGTFDFTVDESVAGVDTAVVDGEALAVVYENPALPSREIYLYEGGVTSFTPEPLTIPLLTPYSGGRARMGVGISYSTGTCLNPDQVTIISVEYRQLTPCAGGWDDGDSLANGALITVGGLGDDFLNPAESRADDEKYDLAPFLTVGDTAIDFTFTTSVDDSLFALAVVITEPTARAASTNDMGALD